MRSEHCTRASVSFSSFSPSVALFFLSKCPTSVTFTSERERGFGHAMARSREVSEVWLWRAISWPLARLSTLFGLAGEARSNRVAGRHQLETCFNVSSASSSSRCRIFLLSLKPLSQVWILCWPKRSDKVSYAAVFCDTFNKEIHILYFTLFLIYYGAENFLKKNVFDYLS